MILPPLPPHSLSIPVETPAEKVKQFLQSEDGRRAFQAVILESLVRSAKKAQEVFVKEKEGVKVYCDRCNAPRGYSPSKSIQDHCVCCGSTKVVVETALDGRIDKTFY